MDTLPAFQQGPQLGRRGKRRFCCSWSSGLSAVPKGQVVSGTEHCAQASLQHGGARAKAKTQRTSPVSHLQLHTLESKETTAPRQLECSNKNRGGKKDTSSPTLGCKVSRSVPEPVRITLQGEGHEVGGLPLQQLGQGDIESNTKAF